MSPRQLKLMAFHFPDLNRDQSYDSMLTLISVKACGDVFGSISKQKIVGVCKKKNKTRGHGYF